MIYPLGLFLWKAYGQYASTVKDFCNEAIWPVLVVFLGMGFFITEIFGYFISQKSTKMLKIDQKLVVTMFNGQILEFEFNGLESIEWSHDRFYNFILTKKNGETVLIYGGIQKPEKAFLLIAQKIKEVKSDT